jgi:hypothetical protein
MRLHSQNLNEHPGGRKGPMLLAGRAWLWLREDERGNSPRIGVEWRLARLGLGARLTIEALHGDDDFTLSLQVPGIALYLSPEGVLPRWVPRPRRDAHTIGFSVHDGGVWWDVWQNDVEWRSGTPRWRHGHFNPADWLLGRPVYAKRVLKTEQAEVPMPEGCYPATVELREDTWKRPRWPWPRRLLRADIAVEKGVPHPGKGENAWDCGEDATYDLTTPAQTVEEAVAKLVQSVLRDRRRYGGLNWRPAAAAEKGER